MKAPATTNPLRERGIAAVAQRAGWEPFDYYGRAGWHYPVRDFAGTLIGWRWKAQDSSTTPKYVWLEGKAHYYVPQAIEALRAAIADAGGVLYIANGEPGLLSYLAAGRYNVLCWFGETSVPSDLPATLYALGVTHIRYPADKDEAGRKSAAKVRDALRDSGIQFAALQWGDALPNKADANDLWQLVQFDAARFQSTLTTLAALILPSEDPKAARQRATIASTDTVNKSEAIERVAAALGVKGWKDNGWSKPVRCPHHDDKHASANLNKDSGTLKCFVCGTFKLEDNTAHFNIDYSSRPSSAGQGRKRQRKAERPAPAAPKPFADIVLNQPYVTLPNGTKQRCIAVQSDVGTGKTKAAIRVAQQSDKVLS